MKASPTKVAVAQMRVYPQLASTGAYSSVGLYAPTAPDFEIIRKNGKIIFKLAHFPHFANTVECYITEKDKPEVLVGSINLNNSQVIVNIEGERNPGSLTVNDIYKQAYYFRTKAYHTGRPNISLSSVIKMPYSFTASRSTQDNININWSLAWVDGYGPKKPWELCAIYEPVVGQRRKYIFMSSSKAINVSNAANASLGNPYQTTFVLRSIDRASPVGRFTWELPPIAKQKILKYTYGNWATTNTVTVWAGGVYSSTDSAVLKGYTADKALHVPMPFSPTTLDKIRIANTLTTGYGLLIDTTAYGQYLANSWLYLNTNGRFSQYEYNPRTNPNMTITDLTNAVSDVDCFAIRIRCNDFSTLRLAPTGVKKLAYERNATVYGLQDGLSVYYVATNTAKLELTIYQRPTITTYV